MKPFIFLSENYLTRAQDSEGAAVDLRTLNAQVPFSQTIFLNDRYGDIVNKKIDTLIINGTNIVNMTVEKADGLGNYTTLFSISGNDKENLILTLPVAVETSSLRFTILDDNYNPENVKIEFMGAFKYLCNLLALTDASFKIEANQGGYRVVNGDFINFADYNKWTNSLKIENLPKEQFDILAQQTREAGEMTVIPYEELEAEAIYECAVNREISYTVDRKTELFTLDMELNEL